MRVKVLKWGDSLAVRLPEHVVEGAGLVDGSAVEISVQGSAIVLSPIQKRCGLDELLAGYKPEHRHKEVDWGAAVGKEVW